MFPSDEMLFVKSVKFIDFSEKNVKRISKLTCTVHNCNSVVKDVDSLTAKCTAAGLSDTDVNAYLVYCSGTVNVLILDKVLIPDKVLISEKVIICPYFGQRLIFVQGPNFGQSHIIG